MNYPCQSSSGDKCLQTFELNPRDPTGAEFKYYLPGRGFVLATKLDEDGMPTGEREEVTCIADSLEDVLNGTTETDCGITDTAALQEALCVWAPGTPLCEFDD
jgi:hypothetical protein